MRIRIEAKNFTGGLVRRIRIVQSGPVRGSRPGAAASSRLLARMRSGQVDAVGAAANTRASRGSVRVRWLWIVASGIIRPCGSTSRSNASSKHVRHSPGAAVRASGGLRIGRGHAWQSVSEERAAERGQRHPVVPRLSEPDDQPAFAHAEPIAAALRHHPSDEL